MRVVKVQAGDDGPKSCLHAEENPSYPHQIGFRSFSRRSTDRNYETEAEREQAANQQDEGFAESTFIVRDEDGEQRKDSDRIEDGCDDAAREWCRGSLHNSEYIVASIPIKTAKQQTVAYRRGA